MIASIVNASVMSLSVESGTVAEGPNVASGICGAQKSFLGDTFRAWTADQKHRYHCLSK